MKLSREMGGVIFMIVLDISEISEKQIFTGIQRIIRSVVDNRPKEVKLIRYDQDSNRFFLVDDIPGLVFRNFNSVIGKFKLKTRNFFLFSSKKNKKFETFLNSGFLSDVVTKIYWKFFSDMYLIDNKKWKSGDAWEIRKEDKYINLDIISDVGHQSKIEEIISSGLVDSSFYFHDLIPISHWDIIKTEGNINFLGVFTNYLNIISKSTNLYCNSQTTKKNYEKYINIIEYKNQKQNIEVLYPPLDDSFFNLNHEISQLDGKKVKVLAIGALNKRKNFQLLIRAILILETMMNDVELIIVATSSRAVDDGIFELLESLPPKQRKLINIKVSINEQELQKNYLEASVVAVPSLVEGFGLPLLEAWQMNKPALVSDIEVFLELSELLPNCRVVTQNTPSEWAINIATLLQRKTDKAALAIEELKMFKNPREFISIIAGMR